MTSAANISPKLAPDVSPGISPGAVPIAEDEHSAASHGPMIERLMLSNFRNYVELTLDIEAAGDTDHGQTVVLAGENGAGKTNLLEAISYLSPGRGLRGARLSDVTRQGARRPWAVSARLATKAGLRQIGTGLQVAVASPGGSGAADKNDGDLNTPDVSGRDRPADRTTDRRSVRIDGESARPADLGGIYSMIGLMPRMDRIFMDGASDRRRFFDQFVLALHPGHGRQLASADRALRERMRLLSQNGGNADPAWLSALEQQIAEHAVAIAAARNDTLDHLAGFIEAAPDTAFPSAEIALEGTLETLLRDQAALAVEDTYLGMLRDQRGEDARSGRTATGPHRSDLRVTHSAKNMPARQCSTGEQKALLIGLVLANAAMLRAVTGVAPILLLDEVAAHLDEPRRKSLFEGVRALRCQAWMTGTDMSLFDALGSGETGIVIRLSVAQGVVSRWVSQGSR